MKPTFLQATDERIPEILQMMADFNSIDHYPFDREVCRQNLTTFIHDNNLGHLWTIHLEDVVAGYIVLTFGFSFEYEGRDAFIDELFIKEAFRDKGIGRQAMQFVEQRAKELKVMALHLEVEKSNARGNRLYTSLGYRGNNRALLTRKLLTNSMLDVHPQP